MNAKKTPMKTPMRSAFIEIIRLIFVCSQLSMAESIITDAIWTFCHCAQDEAFKMSKFSTVIPKKLVGASIQQAAGNKKEIIFEIYFVICIQSVLNTTNDLLDCQFRRVYRKRFPSNLLICHNLWVNIILIKTLKHIPFSCNWKQR